MAQPTTDFALTNSVDDERVRPFLPLVYAAWADGELTSDEIAGICTAVALYPAIDVDCQVALRHWLDPSDPPTPGDLNCFANAFSSGQRCLMHRRRLRPPRLCHPGPNPGGSDYRR